MATSKHAVGSVHMAIPPATLGATAEGIAGGSTPAENYQVFSFDPDTVEYVDFLIDLHENYAATTGVDVVFNWFQTSGTGGLVAWAAALRRIKDDADIFTDSHTYVYTQLNDTGQSVSGESVKATIALTSGANMDSAGAGDMCVLRLKRVATDGTNDTFAGDALLFPNLKILET